MITTPEEAEKIAKGEIIYHKGLVIKDMTDIELDWELTFLNDMVNDVIEKRKDPKFLKKMKGQPPAPINPKLLQLIDTIKTEIEARKNKGV